MLQAFFEEMTMEGCFCEMTSNGMLYSNKLTFKKIFII